MYIFRLSQLIVSRTSSIYISYGSVNLSIHHVILSYDTFHRSLLLLIRFNLIYVTFIVTSIFVSIIFETLLRLDLHTKYLYVCLCVFLYSKQRFTTPYQPNVFCLKKFGKYKHQAHKTFLENQSYFREKFIR